MCAVRGPASVWKRRAILKHRFPAYVGELEQVINDHWNEELCDFLDPSFGQLVYDLYLEDIAPFAGLSDDARQKIVAEFTTSSPERLNWHLTHAWLEELGEYQITLRDRPNSIVQEMYRDIEEIQHRDFAETWEANEALLFFNDVSADARFKYWRELSHWEPEEAAALSLGKDPRVVNRKNLKKRLREIQKKSPFVRIFIERVELISRAVEAGALESPINPGTFMKWAEDVGLLTPKELYDETTAISKRGNSKSSVSIEHKQLVSTYKIITGLAKHLSGGAVHKEASSITKALDLAGVSLTQETVKKIIDEAKSYKSVL